jgi:hypothetical protein
VQIWSYHYPANEVPWPGNSGTITRVPIPKNRYLAEQFVVPTDGSVTDQIQWVFANSGANSNFSLSVSICPGDFGQTGTQTTSASCIRSQAQSSSGLYANVGGSSGCVLTAGETYYLNVLPQGNPPDDDVSVSSCTSQTKCEPWMARY